MSQLIEQFGHIDVYLFDQLLRGRIIPDMRVLDAGCGGGRNLVYLERHGARAVGLDRDPTSSAAVRGALEALPFPNASFDCVICNAVLHFAPDEASFTAMVAELWRALAPGGIFFVRLASAIGIEDSVRRLRGRWCKLPDGTERFLVDEALLLETGEELGASLLDPIKTTNVQGLRCMTTWVLGKPE